MSDDQSFLELSGIHHSLGENKAELNSQEFGILKGLSPLRLRILNDASRVLHTSKGVEIMHEGDNPHDLYFIKSGKVAVARHSGSQNKVAAVLRKGDLFGEFGLLRKKPRVASVFTTEPSILVRVKSEAVYQVIQADDEFKQRLERLLNYRVLSAFFFSHPIFSGLPEVTRLSLANELNITTIQSNERIFSQGDKPDGICMIIAGEVEIVHRNNRKEDILVEVRRNNDLLSEIAVNNGTALAYSAITASNLDMLCLNMAAMKKLKTSHPEVFQKLEAYIAKRAAQTASRLKELNKPA